MSDMKRVMLTTIGDVKRSPFGGSGSDPDGHGPSFFAGAFSGQGNSGAEAGSAKNGSASGSKSQRKTFRLELELFEPTANSFPEFNYSKLVREEQKRKRKKEKKAAAPTNGFLSDPEQNDDVARIAAALEKKYGSGTAYSSEGRNARSSRLDYCDRGAGYDEDDSFIDNTEAYDELIPLEVETVGGGFYINSGQLEFKTLSNFERPEDAQRMPKPKKRLLSTSSESSEDDRADTSAVTVVAATKPTKKIKEGSVGSGTSGAESGSKDDRKRLNGHNVKKRKLGEEDGKKSSKMSSHKEAKQKKKEGKEAGVVSVVGGKDVKVIKTTTVKDMLRAKRDSLRKMEQEKKGRTSGSASSSEAEEDGEGDEEDDDDDGSDGSDSDSSGSGSDDSDSESATGSDHDSSKINGSGVGVVPEENSKKRIEVKLPDNLPDHLVQDLDSLKDIAKNTSGKINFLVPSIADLLLQIDVTSRMCGGSARNAVYKHLEGHLQVSRQTLMMKIKKIRIRKEETKVKKALGKLEDAVTEVMPKVITHYEMEKQKTNELRLTLAAAAVSGEGAEKPPEIKSPRKKFPWNDHLRGLLYDIAAIRKQSFHILRPRKETEEDYIQSYLKKNVVPLWPNGWVKFEDLQKELDRRKKTGHNKSTSKEVKKTVQLSSSPAANSPVHHNQSTLNGPGGGVKLDTVLSPSVKLGAATPSGKSDDRKLVRTPQASPGLSLAGGNLQPPPPSTSPATNSKRTSDHSIINIMSSPPTSAAKSSSHSSHFQQQQQPPRPQSQPPQRPPSSSAANFDEDLIQAHVINLETAHSATKTSTANIDYHPKDLRMTSPALSSASSASSSRRQSFYQENPPLAHTSSTTPTTSTPISANRKDRKSMDDDSDSSIEIVGEYNVGDTKKFDPLNLALPAANKDKYKKTESSSSSKGSKYGSNNHHNSSGGSSSSKSINNNQDKSGGKYGGSSKSMTSGFALPPMGAALMQDGKTSSAAGAATASTMLPRMASAPGELDVLRIMKEIQELQAIQSNSMSKTPGQHDSRKSTNTASGATPNSSARKIDPSNLHASPAAMAAAAAAAAAAQKAVSQQQQSHHNKYANKNQNGKNRGHSSEFKPKPANPSVAASKIAKS